MPIDNYLPRCIAHRGASQLKTENTIAALKTAAQAGATWVEFDIQLSADEKVMVYHDEWLMRLCQMPYRLNQLTQQHLQTIDTGAFSNHADLRIASFKHWIKTAAALNMGMNIEIKSIDKVDLLMLKTLDLLKSYWPSHLPRPLISSFDTTLVEGLSAWRTAPTGGDSDYSFDIALLFDQWPEKKLPQLLSNSDCCSVHLDESIATAQRVEQLNKLGKWVACYTVNDIDRAQQLFDIGVGTVFTDNMQLCEYFQ